VEAHNRPSEATRAAPKKARTTSEESRLSSSVIKEAARLSDAEPVKSLRWLLSSLVIALAISGCATAAPAPEATSTTAVCDLVLSGDLERLHDLSGELGESVRALQRTLDSLEASGIVLGRPSTQQEIEMRRRPGELAQEADELAEAADELAEALVDRAAALAVEGSSDADAVLDYAISSQLIIRTVAEQGIRGLEAAPGVLDDVDEFRGFEAVRAKCEASRN